MKKICSRKAVKNCSWEAETQGEKQTIHSKKNPTDLHPRVEELQKELNRLQENKAPPDINSKQEVPQTTKEGDSEEEAKAKEAEAAETRESSEKTR